MLSSLSAFAPGGSTATLKGQTDHITQMSFLRCGKLLRSSSTWQGHILDRLSATTRILPERMQIRAAAAAAKEAKSDNQASAKVAHRAA